MTIKSRLAKLEANHKGQNALQSSAYTDEQYEQSIILLGEVIRKITGFTGTVENVLPILKKVVTE